MNKDILSVIGNTPLVQLKNVIEDISFNLFAKIEALNPGGSIKDRAALFIIENALSEKKINSETVIVESSSGNMGIGLAQACALRKLRFICVVDPRTTQQNIRIMKAYGAEIDLVSEPDAVTGDFLQARINRVMEIMKEVDNSYWTNQYSNIFNYRAHYETMHEIMSELDNKVDFLFCSVSTCGTIRGCSEYVRQNNLKTKVIGVDAVGSVIFGGQRGARMLPGHGAGIVPELHKPELVDQYVYVTDEDCIRGCRKLVGKEAILAGGSSGGVLSAVEKIRDSIGKDANCVLIFPDRGERYLDTIYSDEWVNQHFNILSN